LVERVTIGDAHAAARPRGTGVEVATLERAGATGVEQASERTGGW
jgi:hypothetical protein